MRVLLINGSPHKEGCTNRALQEVAITLNQEGIETEVFWIGNKPIGGCQECRNKASGKGNRYLYKLSEEGSLPLGQSSF